MQVLDYDGTDHLVDKIYDLINSGGSADYIVEQGTSGIWTYRKWASGVAECWGMHTYTNVPLTRQWGSGYIAPSGQAQGNEAYPFTFYSQPHTAKDMAGFNGWIMNDSKGSTTHFPIYWLYSTSSGNRSADVHLYARGLWKEFTPSSTGSTYSPIDLNALNKDALRYIKCADKGITNANNMTNNGIYTGYSLSNAPQTGWTAYIVFKHDNNGNYIHQIAYPIGAASKFWIRAYNGQAGWTSWNQYNQN